MARHDGMPNADRQHPQTPVVEIRCCPHIARTADTYVCARAPTYPRHGLVGGCESHLSRSVDPDFSPLLAASGRRNITGAGTSAETPRRCRVRHWSENGPP